MEEVFEKVVIPKRWSTVSLCPEAQSRLLDLYLADKRSLTSHRSAMRSWVKLYRTDSKSSRSSKNSKKDSGNSESFGGSLFSLMASEDSEIDNQKPVLDNVKASRIRWGTDGYKNPETGRAYKASKQIDESALSLIRPRVEKTTVEQKRRVKEKAEVFTPTWVVNKMNNLIDDSRIFKNAFNSVSEDLKSWTASDSPVDFKNSQSGMSWEDYVSSPVLEMTMGEAPYLCSPYDPTTGHYISLRDAEGRFQRVGLLDRKLRVASENSETVENFLKWGFIALESTYGYEWQGDNLVLARLNVLNTFFDYFRDFVETKTDKNLDEWLSEDLLNDLSVTVLSIVSSTLVQMDGLKMVLPMTCSDTCKSCDKGLKIDHDGEVPVFEISGKFEAFEDFLR